MNSSALVLTKVASGARSVPKPGHNQKSVRHSRQGSPQVLFTSEPGDEPVSWRRSKGRIGHQGLANKFQTSTNNPVFDQLDLVLMQG